MSLLGAAEIAAAAAPTTTALLDTARRRLAVARWTNVALVLFVGSGFALGSLLQLDWLALLALLAASVWILLVVRSARLIRRIREASAALQLGQTDIAQIRAMEALHAYSLLRPVTLSAVQVLAQSAHRSGRHAEAARLAGYVLSRPEQLIVGERTDVRLLLVDSLLATAQVAGAQAAALPLYAQKLQFPEALRLLGLQLRIEAHLGAYVSMAERLSAKVDMAELMPPRESALAQALLGAAAHRCGGHEWAAWLWRRVNLLADWSALQQREPALAGLGADFAPVAVHVDRAI